MEPVEPFTALINYTEATRIPKGTDSDELWKAVDRRTGKRVVLSKLRFAVGDALPYSAIQEFSVLAELKHPNIVAFEDVIIHTNRVFLVTECAAMNLSMFIHGCGKFRRTGIKMKKSFLHQILQGTHFLHQRQIIHRDLNPYNVLIDRNGCLKLTDFGILQTYSWMMFEQEAALRYIEGASWYQAPELLLGASGISTAADIWGIGCIFAEMLLMDPLFSGDTENTLILEIFRILSTPTEETWPGVTQTRHFNPEFPVFKGIDLKLFFGSRITPDGLRILQKMLIYDPGRRISAEQLLKDTYFHDLRRTKRSASENLQLPPR